MEQRAEVGASDEPALPGEGGSTAGSGGGLSGGERLIGREALVRRAAALLEDPEVRLLTLTGPGGIGKTTLANGVAAEVGDAFPGGVAVVELAAEREPGRILASVVEALGLEPEGDEPALATLARAIDGRRLLVLDNLEQLLGGVGAVGELLAACHGLAVMATSRTRLGLTGEREVAVPPLALPDAATRPVGEVAASPAVELFVRRARRANPAFALTAGNAVVVAEVCRRLDGLPLALELGAARLRLLSPEALLARLDARLELLSGGPRDAPARHRTIRDTVAWSVDLLRPEERRVFGYLAVFAGGCRADDLAAVAEAVEAEVSPGTPDVAAAVAALVDGSLLSVSEDANGEGRLAMLESIRDVAGEMLVAEGGLADVARRRHAERYLLVAERDGPALRGDSATSLRVWNLLAADIGNHRAALAWFLAAGETESGLRLAAGLDWFWTDLAYLREGIDWLERLVALAGDGAAVPRRVWGDTHRVLAMLHDWLGHEDATERAVGEAIRALAEAEAHASLAEILIAASGAAGERGELVVARGLAERCLAITDAHHLDWLGATMRANLAYIVALLGDPAAAAAHATASIDRYGRAGERGRVVAATVVLGMAQVLGDDPDAAGASLSAALAEVEASAASGETEEPYFQLLFAGVAMLAGRSGQAERAAHLFAAGAAEIRRSGVPHRAPLQRILDDEVGRLRSTLGEPRLAAEWAIGSDLTPADQMTLADEVLRSHRSPTLSGKLTELSGRQLEVLRLVMAGASDKDIADRLFIARRTASEHVANILAILGQGSRTGAAGYAAANGLRAGSPVGANPESSG